MRYQFTRDCILAACLVLNIASLFIGRANTKLIDEVDTAAGDLLTGIENKVAEHDQVVRGLCFLVATLWQKSGEPLPAPPEPTPAFSIPDDDALLEPGEDFDPSQFTYWLNSWYKRVLV
jgi:hypothetical protein